MHTRTIESKRDDKLKSTLQSKTAQEPAVKGAELTAPQNKMLAMQSQRGNQYVLRMINQGAFPGAKVQREDEESDQQQGADGSNSMIGDLLGLNGVSGKVKQVVDKTKQGVDQGIDWVTGKVAGGAKKVEEWLED